MANWQEFEIECTEYLNDTYGNIAKFTHEGGSDSTKADINVITKIGNEFYIDVKQSPAQCGQFVLLPDIKTQTFIYSPLNATLINDDVKTIMNHMNSDFDNYKESGTKGSELIFDNCANIFCNWIFNYYKSKDVKYFITNEFIILPIEKISTYFDIKAMYRVKRSGSSGVGKSNATIILNYIKSNFNILSHRLDGAKLFVSSDNNIHNTRFILNGYEYMLSKRDDEYEIRKLSNTFNANVIFSISLKSKQASDDLLAFESEINL